MRSGALLGFRNPRLSLASTNRCGDREFSKSRLILRCEAQNETVGPVAFLQIGNPGLTMCNPQRQVPFPEAVPLAGDSVHWITPEVDDWIVRRASSSELATT